MTAARRHEQVQHRRTQERQQRERRRRGDSDARVTDDRAVTYTRLPYPSDDAHNARIKRKLQDDTRRTTRRLGEGTDVARRRPVKKNARKKKQHDDGVEVQRTASHKKLDNQETEA